VAEHFANKFQTTLAAPLTSGATEFDAGTTTGMPAVPFRGIFAAEGVNTDEVVLVTNAVGTTLTITRAAEAVAGVQAASAHAAGATFTAILTAEGLSQLTATPTLAEVLAAGNATGGWELAGSSGRLGLDDGAYFTAADNDGGNFQAYSGPAGKVGIRSASSTGTIGQIITAQGDGSAIWDDNPAGATPTLAEVLAAGNDPGGIAIVGASDGVNGGASVMLEAGTGESAGFATFRGGAGAVGFSGGGVTFLAGSGDANGAEGSAVTVEPGVPGYIGRIRITTDNSTGTLGQVLTAQGNQTAIWDDLALQPAANVPASEEALYPTTAEYNALIAAMRASGLMAQVPASLEFGQQPTNAVVYVAPQNEIQRITGGGVISGGTWTLIQSGPPLAGLLGNIPWDVSAAGLQTLLADGGPEVHLVTGGPLASAPFDIEFVGLGNVNEVTVDATNLTGTDPTLTPSTVQDGRAEAGIISPAVTVRVLDDLGNLCTREIAAVTVALTTPGGATLAGTATKVPVAGVATFDDLAVDVAATYTLTVTDGALTPVESDPFTIS
jgi:hypothetical protein